MKTRLANIKELKILKRNTKLEPDQIYLLCSESIAKNIYFETKRDIEFAHHMINKYIKYIGEVLEYLITPTGWMILLKTHEEETILSLIKKKATKSTTIKKAIRKRDVSVLISEIIRIILSSVSRQINRNNRRKGSVVKGNFSRYVFNSIDAVIALINKMKEEEIELDNQRAKFRTKGGNWKKKNKLGFGNVLLCTKNRIRSRAKGLISLDSLGIIKHVLRGSKKEIIC